MGGPAEPVSDESWLSSCPGAGQELERLESLLDLIAEGLDGLDPIRPVGTDKLDPGVVAGSSAQAQENRAIHITRARLATERAREARERLPGLVAQARAGVQQVRAFRDRSQVDRLKISQALKTAMPEVTPAEDPDASLRSVARGAVAGIPFVDAATVALRDNKRRLLQAIGSDATAEALTDHQTTTRQGPCLDVARTLAVVESPDLAADDVPWPVFAPAAVAIGVRSVIVMPLRTENAERYRKLEQALHNRDLIGQAKGILMVRRGLGSEEAYRLLVRSSQETNVKVVAVARWVVENLAAPESG